LYYPHYKTNEISLNTDTTPKNTKRPTTTHDSTRVARMYHPPPMKIISISSNSTRQIIVFSCKSRQP
jgi:hypothetical protein